MFSRAFVIKDRFWEAPQPLCRPGPTALVVTKMLITLETRTAVRPGTFIKSSGPRNRSFRGCSPNPLPRPVPAAKGSLKPVRGSPYVPLYLSSPRRFRSFNPIYTHNVQGAPETNVALYGMCQCVPPPGIDFICYADTFRVFRVYSSNIHAEQKLTIPQNFPRDVRTRKGLTRLSVLITAKIIMFVEFRGINFFFFYVSANLTIL